MNKIKMSEISNLINIRNYLKLAVDNFSIEKVKVNKISKILVHLDNSIVDSVISWAEHKEGKDDKEIP